MRRTTSHDPADCARLLHTKAVQTVCVRLSKRDKDALDSLIKLANSTASQSTLIRYAIRAFANHASSLRGQALERLLQDANKETYAADGH